MIHFLTGEYSPATGGVADYTALVAHELAHHGEQVHVWAGGRDGVSQENGVTVHRVAGTYSPAGLAMLDNRLSDHPAPRRLIVQWTPHSYGFRSLNIPFAAWIWKRAHIDGDSVELMIHEPFLAFHEGRWKQNAAAAVHRAMIAMLLDAAERVWISIPAWEAQLDPWCLRASKPFLWLPVPANITAFPDARTAMLTRDRLTPAGEPLIGHFGTFRKDVAELLAPALAEILRSTSSSILLIGYNSTAFRNHFTAIHRGFGARVIATGELPAKALAENLSACDVMLQPYPDGISSRRGTAMAALSLGLPIVTNLGHLSEPVWRASGAVELASSAAAPSLCSATLSLLNDRGRRVTLQVRARGLYNERFHVHHTAVALLGNFVPARLMQTGAAA